MTESMKKAIGETERRRTKQVAFNLANGITPRGVQKKIQDVMRLGYETLPEEKRKAGGARAVAEAASDASVDLSDPGKLGRAITKLEKEMKQAAINLEFEKAGRIRDRIRQLREQALRSAVA